MPDTALLAPEKFQDPMETADGKARACVKFGALTTLWINTGTLCNLTCRNCYIESSPTNDALVYISRTEVQSYLDEIDGMGMGQVEIGFTGGEPFMNPEIIGMLEDVMERGHSALVLTNAMKPMHKVKERLLALHAAFPGKMTIRVSLDHHSPSGHEQERGDRTWQAAIKGLTWLGENGFDIHVAGRTFMDEDEHQARAGYAQLFSDLGLSVDAQSPAELILFPEMDETRDVPEITTECWGILNVDPASIMCASSRTVIKRKGALTPTVVACTLLPYDREFDLGGNLATAFEPIQLNHPHCARFCVLGGASCSSG
jgi:MoaA/NifB/PqqE/SkfB family radical SAM enzyme